MSAVILRLRAELRARWRAWLALGVAIGVAGGAVVALAAAERRTQSAYGRYLQVTAPASDYVDGGLWLQDKTVGVVGRFAHLPQVVGSERTFIAAVASHSRTGRPVNATGPGHIQFQIPADNRPENTIDRPLLLSGRLPDPRRKDEVLADRRALATLGIGLGDTLTVRLMRRDFILAHLTAFPSYPDTAALGSASHRAGRRGPGTGEGRRRRGLCELHPGPTPGKRRSADRGLERGAGRPVAARRRRSPGVHRSVVRGRARPPLRALRSCVQPAADPTLDRPDGPGAARPHRGWRGRGAVARRPGDVAHGAGRCAGDDDLAGARDDASAAAGARRRAQCGPGRAGRGVDGRDRCPALAACARRLGARARARPRIWFDALPIVVGAACVVAGVLGAGMVGGLLALRPDGRSTARPRASPERWLGPDCRPWQATA